MHFFEVFKIELHRFAKHFLLYRILHPPIRFASGFSVPRKIVLRMADPKPRQMMTCPYNKAHQVEQYRMHIHLQKCRKQHPNEAVSNCPFDATHVIRDVEMDYHVRHCPKRILLDSQMYITDDDHRSTPQLPPPQLDHVSAENWDDDNVETYDPLKAKKGAPIIIKSIKGATKSQRNAARMEGRLAYAAAMQNQHQE